MLSFTHVYIHIADVTQPGSTFVVNVFKTEEDRFKITTDDYCTTIHHIPFIQGIFKARPLNVLSHM